MIAAERRLPLAPGLFALSDKSTETLIRQRCAYFISRYATESLVKGCNAHFSETNPPPCWQSYLSLHFSIDTAVCLRLGPQSMSQGC